MRKGKGICVGFGLSHGSEVPLNLNPLTGHISPKFYVVFDDLFSTVSSIYDIDETPSFWNEFDLDEFMYQIPLEKSSGIILNNEWLAPQERERKEKGKMCIQLIFVIEVNIF